LKLEIKVQVPGSSPRDAEFETSCPELTDVARAPSRRPGNRKTGRELSAEIEFYPSYAVFKERAGNVVELIGFEPTTSSLQSWRSPS
jgi:hypothetical protein